MVICAAPQAQHPQQTALPREPLGQAADVPPFYFPPASGSGAAEARQHLESRVTDFLAPFLSELPLAGLKTLLRDAFGLPTCLAYPLLHRLAPGSDNLLPTAALHAWLVATGFAGKSPAEQLFEVLRVDGQAFVAAQDLRPLLTGILVSHPGLAFLRDSPEFQDRYAETVIHRVFFKLNRSGSGQLSLRDLKRCALRRPAWSACSACMERLWRRPSRPFAYFPPTLF
jgi:serine/threonine-protein phosphatase 2A regulatory subunit B''